MLGCGNSALGEVLYDAGWKNIVNIDVSRRTQQWRKRETRDWLLCRSTPKLSLNRCKNDTLRNDQRWHGSRWMWWISNLEKMNLTWSLIKVGSFTCKIWTRADNNSRNDGVSSRLSRHFRLWLILQTVLCWQRKAIHGYDLRGFRDVLNLTFRRIPQKKISEPAPKKFQKLSGKVPFLQTYLLIPSSLDMYPAFYGNVRDPNLPSEYCPLVGRAYQSYHINSSFTFGQPHFRKRYASTSFSYSYSPSHGFNADKANMSIDTCKIVPILRSLTERLDHPKDLRTSYISWLIMRKLKGDLGLEDDV